MKYPYGIISKGWRYFRAKILRQFYTNFNQNIYEFKGDLYLDGFFQTEKYFVEFEDQIRNDFELKIPLSVVAENASTMIKGYPSDKKNGVPYSISLHIRRGDYVTDAKTNQNHGTCEASYYSKALEYLTSKVGSSIHLFVFSDDIEWVKQNMPFQYPVTYVSSPEIRDYEELHLMSLCDHHIIANSSFSWWGAWLNRKSHKLVIAPKRWARGDESHYTDIVPSSWIRI